MILKKGSIHYIAIAAMAKNRIIGNEGKIPWYIPEDFKHFRDTTAGSPIIMGRKTFQSIGRVLPGRENIVLTRGIFTYEGVKVFHSIDDIDTYLHREKREKAYICGGSEIYNLYLERKMIDEIILSIVDMNPEGDAFFPTFENDFIKIDEEKRDGFIIERWYRRENIYKNSLREEEENPLHHR